MKLACIHTHTVFCDGSDDVETCCRMAHEKGLCAIGFSAHAPISKKTGFKTSWNLPEEKLQEYIESILSAKKRWKGRLPIYLGLELDFIPGLIGPADRDYRDLNLDYIIGSVHFVISPRGGIFAVDAPPQTVAQSIKEGFDGQPMGMVEAYWNSLEAMIRAGGFDLLGHPDLIKKNNLALGFFSEDGDLYREKTASIAALMARAAVPAEINTGGLNRGRTRDCYPSLAFLKLFREHGVPMVINADAHQAEHLDGHYDEARKSLLAANYTETLLFEGRKDGKAVWNSVKL